jgi:hypothetical protein
MHGMGRRRGILLIPKGCEGWGWQKFAGELNKAKDFLFATVGFAMVGCGTGSSLSAEKKGGKEEGLSYGSSLIGVPSPVVKKDRKEVLGLKVSPQARVGLVPFWVVLYCRSRRW